MLAELTGESPPEIALFPDSAVHGKRELPAGGRWMLRWLYGKEVVHGSQKSEAQRSQPRASTWYRVRSGSEPGTSSRENSSKVAP